MVVGGVGSLLFSGGYVYVVAVIGDLLADFEDFVAIYAECIPVEAHRD